MIYLQRCSYFEHLMNPIAVGRNGRSLRCFLRWGCQSLALQGLLRVSTVWRWRLEVLSMTDVGLANTLLSVHRRRRCLLDLVQWAAQDGAGLFSVFLSLSLPRSPQDTWYKTLQRPPRCWRESGPELGSHWRSSVSAAGGRDSRE